MATKKTYIIRINNFITDPEKCNTVDLEYDYDDPEKVAEDGWLILEAFAALHGLEYENQLTNTWPSIRKGTRRPAKVR